MPGQPENFGRLRHRCRTYYRPGMTGANSKGCRLALIHPDPMLPHYGSQTCVQGLGGGHAAVPVSMLSGKIFLGLHKSAGSWASLTRCMTSSSVSENISGM